MGDKKYGKNGFLSGTDVSKKNQHDSQGRSFNKELETDLFLKLFL